jgi:16S rRNA (cytosine967-C5)-methyltransferase
VVAAFLDVKPGMRVVDTCAGAGGKTLHMAALMENKDY